MTCRIRERAPRAVACKWRLTEPAVGPSAVKVEETDQAVTEIDLSCPYEADVHWREHDGVHRVTTEIHQSFRNEAVVCRRDMHRLMSNSCGKSIVWAVSGRPASRQNSMGSFSTVSSTTCGMGTSINDGCAPRCSPGGWSHCDRQPLVAQRRRSLQRRALDAPPPASSRAAISNDATRKGASGHLQAVSKQLETTPSSFLFRTVLQRCGVILGAHASEEAFCTWESDSERPRLPQRKLHAQCAPKNHDAQTVEKSEACVPTKNDTCSNVRQFPVPLQPRKDKVGLVFRPFNVGAPVLAPFLGPRRLLRLFERRL